MSSKGHSKGKGWQLATPAQLNRRWRSERGARLAQRDNREYRDWGRSNAASRDASPEGHARFS
jgi:hypothetical protein